MKRSDRRTFLKTASALAVAGASQSFPSPAIAQGVRITMWHWLTRPDDAVWAGLLAEWNRRRPDLQVAVDHVPLAEFRQKALTADQSGAPPDVSRIHPAWLGELDALDALEPLDQRVDGWTHRRDLFDEAIRVCRPMSSRPMIMLPILGQWVYLAYYRNDWLQEAGLGVPGTWDEYLVAAKAMTRPPDRFGFSMRGGIQGWAHGWVNMFYAYGLSIVDERGGIGVNSAQAIERNQWFLDLYRVHRVTAPSAINDGFPQIAALWRAGRAGSFFHGVHAQSSFTETAGDRVIGAPVPRGSNAWTRADAIGMSIWRKSRNKNAAWEFLSWLLEPEQHARINLNPLEPNVPALRSVAARADYQGNRFMQAALAQRESWGLLPYWHPYWAEMADVDWHPLFQRALQGQITSKQMLDQLAQGFERAGMPRRR
ncbi:MAG: sugar ABC transporter substrate-binding protein [Alphaproteobacteria bacterium]|nr:sugar ABC transporter substrate-binding protein [Alphaproteobacteria bacterium]